MREIEGDEQNTKKYLIPLDKYLTKTKKKLPFFSFLASLICRNQLDLEEQILDTFACLSFKSPVKSGIPGERERETFFSICISESHAESKSEFDPSIGKKISFVYFSTKFILESTL